MIKMELQLFGGRGGGSGMSGGGRGASQAVEEPVRFGNQQMQDASDDYWNSGWSNKKEAARILSGDLSEDKFVNQYVKDGMKSDKAIQDRIDRNGRDYTNRNWSAKSKADWESEGRNAYNQAMDQAKQYSVGDTAKRLGVDGINWRTSENEARRILGDRTYNALLNESKRGARRAVDSHKRRR